MNALANQALSLGVDIGDLSLDMDPDLSIESLQALVNEAKASLPSETNKAAVSNSPDINDITITDTSEEILANAELFELTVRSKSLGRQGYCRKC